MLENTSKLHAFDEESLKGLLNNLLSKGGNFLSAQCEAFLKMLLTYIENWRVDENFDFSGILSRDFYSSYLSKQGFYILLLEVTTACNMRCKYCGYSGLYIKARTHGNISMNFKTARKAIDLYLSLLDKYKLDNPYREPRISFFGGEPLLNIRLIKDVVKYVKARIKDEFNVEFSMTTNGTLLNTDVIEFLVDNNFNVAVSLDGPKEEHNRNRVFPGGRGSFDVVFENIQKYFDIAKSKGVDPRIGVIAVYDVRTNLMKLNEFFNEIKYLIHDLMIEPVSYYGTTYYEKFSRADFERFYWQLGSLEQDFIHNYLLNGRWKIEENIFYDSFFGKSLILLYSTSRTSLPPTLIPSRISCLPGFKLFVNVNGLITPCEEASDECIVGDIDHGLDFQKVQLEIKNYFRVRSQCLGCPLLFACRLCIAKASFGLSKQACSFITNFFRRKLRLLVQVLKYCPEYIEWLISKSINYTN